MVPFFFAKYRRGVLLVWALLALANLAAGVALASRDERRTDLETMRRWGREWLVERLNIYNLDGEAPDYPPHGIVMLSPLSALPPQHAAAVWAGVNLGLALLVPYLVVQAVRPSATFSMAALPMLMFLSWSGFRTLLQFSLLSLTLGLLSMISAAKRPNWSGVCLGVGLMKPQICIPFLLWAAFTGRRRVIGVATAVVAAGILLFCARVSANPVMLIPQYLGILRKLYTGGDSLIGLAQLRPLLGSATSSSGLAEVVEIIVATTLLAVICLVGFAEGRRTQLALYAAPPLAGLWSLLAFYHLTYGFIVLLPLAALLIFDAEAATTAVRRKMFWVLQLGMMADVPGLWRRFGHLLPVPDSAAALLIHFDRGLVLALFACVLALAVRTLKAPLTQSNL
jgi:hypothetical protein